MKQWGMRREMDGSALAISTRTLSSKELRLLTTRHEQGRVSLSAAHDSSGADFHVVYSRDGRMDLFCVAVKGLVVYLVLGES